MHPFRPMLDSDLKFTQSNYVKSNIYLIQLHPDTVCYDLALLERIGRANWQTRRNVYPLRASYGVFNLVDVAELDGDDAGRNI